MFFWKQFSFYKWQLEQGVFVAKKEGISLVFFSRGGYPLDFYHFLEMNDVKDKTFYFPTVLPASNTGVDIE
jgi:hypothetical protein